MNASSASALDALAAACRSDEERAMEPAMALALAASFGSVDGWHAVHGAALRALAGADGWVVLALRGDGSLVVAAVREPGEVEAAGSPVLAVCHRREADAAPPAIDWGAVYSRYRAAVQAASDGFEVGEEAVGAGVLLDVRRAAVFQAAGDLIPGAAWRDPADVAGWAAEMPAGTPVTVYCVRGHEVSQATVLRLRAAGHDARYLRGGIEAWAAAGHDVQPRGGKP